MFPGEGAQYVGMAAELYRADPIFREHVDRCCELARPHVGLDLRDLLVNEGGEASATNAGRLQRAELAQPALFIVEYALAQMWKQWGIEAVACAGRGVGEYVAACLAGVFSLADAIAIVGTRGRVMQQSDAGAVTDQAIRPFARHHGACEAIRSGDSTRLECVGHVDDAIRGRGSRYWASQLWQPREIVGERQEPDRPREVPSARSGSGPARSHRRLKHSAVSGSVARTVNWDAVRGGERRRRVSLPTYPFERKRYWVDPEPEPEPEPPPPAVEKQADVARWFSLPEWRQTPQPRYYAGGRRVGVTGGPWLVFTDGQTFSDAVCERLTSEVDPGRIVTVARGERYERLSGDRYTVAPGRPEDFRALFESLNVEGRCPDVVAHLWTSADADQLSMEAAQDRGFYSLIWIAQALRSPEATSPSPLPSRSSPAARSRCWASRRFVPNARPLVGAALVIGQEYSASAAA